MVYLIVLAFYIVKSLVFFVGWNYVFINMGPFEPISIGQAFLAMLVIGLLTFSVDFKKEK